MVATGGHAREPAPGQTRCDAGQPSLPADWPPCACWSVRTSSPARCPAVEAAGGASPTAGARPRPATSWSLRPLVRRRARASSRCSPRRCGGAAGCRCRPSTRSAGRRPAQVLLAGDTAYVESAQACGLHLLAAGRARPAAATTLVRAGRAARRRGRGRRPDGRGRAGRLGHQRRRRRACSPRSAPRPLDAAGLRAAVRRRRRWPRWPGWSGAPRLRGAGLVAATDVDNPLLGPARRERGLRPAEGRRAGPTSLLLDAALARFAGVLRAGPARLRRPGWPRCPARGAAGGLGAALLALGGRGGPGIGLVSARLIGLDAALDGADLVITGEGSFDHQSLRGKVVAGVAGGGPRPRACRAWCWPGGSSRAGGRRPRPASTEAYALVEHFGRRRWPPRWPARPTGCATLAARLAAAVEPRDAPAAGGRRPG